MRHWRGWLGVMAIFVSGILVGGVGTKVYMGRYISEMMADGPPEFQSLVVARLSDRLDLSAQQERQVRAIVQAGREEMKVIHDEMLPRIELKILEVAEEVKEVLDPEQREELDVIVQELLDRWHEHLSNRPSVSI